MADKALYVLAGYDEQTEAVLSGIQNEIYALGFSGFQTKNIPMHFTIGAYNIKQEAELKERLITIAQTHKAFRVSFNHIGLFRQPANDVLFIAPEVNKEMLQLKDLFMDSSEPFNWSPHTTLLIDKPEAIQQAIPVVLDTFSTFEGKVVTLHLFEFWPTKHILSVKLS